MDDGAAALFCLGRGAVVVAVASAVVREKEDDNDDNDDNDAGGTGGGGDANQEGGGRPGGRLSIVREFCCELLYHYHSKLCFFTFCVFILFYQFYFENFISNIFKKRTL